MIRPTPQRLFRATLLPASLVLVLLSSPGDAESAASLSGFVYDASDGEALINATVVVDGGALGTLTNVSGYFVLPQVSAGPHELVCTYIGYQAFRTEIALNEGEDATIEIRLDVAAVEALETLIQADSMRTVERLFEKPISQIRLSPRQFNAIPQLAEADLLRSLQSLPGILPLSDFSSALYVRGGTPDQNLYMIDGTDVYNPEHTFGIFSTFNTDAIKQAELSKGGFGAEYGGRLSSVLDVTNLDGNREEFEGKTSISLLSAKTTLQAPMGEIGSLSGSLRRTYFDQTAAKFIDDIPSYYFYDGNLKAYFDLDERNKLTLSGYGGRDFLDIIFNPKATEETGFVVDWGNKTGSVRWTRVFTPKLFSNFWITGSRFSSDFDFPEVELTERNFVSEVAVKGNLEYHSSRHLQTKFGFERKRLNVHFRQDFPEGLIDVHSRPTYYALYGQANWKPNPLWDIESGVRYNLFDSDRTFHNVAPRAALKYRLTDTINLRAATGVYYQYLHRIPRFIATDIWTTSNDYQDESRSVHGILGWQQEIARNFQLEVEGYYKDYANIYQFNETFLPLLEETSHDEAAEPVFTSTKAILILS